MNEEDLPSEHDEMPKTDGSSDLLAGSGEGADPLAAPPFPTADEVDEDDVTAEIAVDPGLPPSPVQYTSSIPPSRRRLSLRIPDDEVSRPDSADGLVDPVSAMAIEGRPTFRPSSKPPKVSSQPPPPAAEPIEAEGQVLQASAVEPPDEPEALELDEAEAAAVLSSIPPLAASDPYLSAAPLIPPDAKLPSIDALAQINNVEEIHDPEELEDATAPHSGEGPEILPDDLVEAVPAALKEPSTEVAPESSLPEGGTVTLASADGPIGILPGLAREASPLAPPPMNETASNRKRVRPWWEDLFNDDFVRTMAKITDDQIAKEADFIEESLGVTKEAMILDLACGTGRHAIELTRRGYQVVGFDLSLPMLARAAEEAQERTQKLNFVHGDMREMTFEDMFDGIYSWNTSFGFFEEEKNAQVVSRVHKALRKGGQFLLDVINRDYIIRQSPSLVWFEGDGCICMDEMQMDWITSRMRIKRTMMIEDGRSREIEYSIRVYALHELGKVLHDHGFRVAEVSGLTACPGVFFGSDSPRTLILAEKR